MTITQAAKKLAQIRDERVGASEEKIESLKKQCDEVGMWLAQQKWSKKIDQLGQEAHQLVEILAGGTGRGRLRISV